MDKKKPSGPISPYAFPGIRHNSLPNDFRNRITKMIKRGPEDITEEFIMDIVSEVTKVSPQNIAGPRRENKIVDARRLYIYNVKKYLGKSYVYIGKSLGNRDHTTITFNIKKYHALHHTEESFRRIADKITNLIEFY